MKAYEKNQSFLLDNILKLVFFLYLLISISESEIQFILKEGQKYPVFKELSLEEFLVILNDGIYIFNINLSNNTQIYKFNDNQTIESEEDRIKIAISEYKYDNDFFVFCLIRNYLYLLDYNKNNISVFYLNESLDGKYYNLIPFKKDNDSIDYLKF